MARIHEHLYALNVGGVDPEALGRVDLEKMRIAGEHPVANLTPRVLGPTTLRPGTEMIAAIPNNAETRLHRFWKAGSGARAGTAYMLLLSASEMRVMNDKTIVSVPAVSATINPAGWSDFSEGTATATGGPPLVFNAEPFAQARLRNAFSVAGAQLNDIHVIRVVVSVGPVYLKVGTTVGGAELLPNEDQIRLDTGEHNIAVTPGVSPVRLEIASTDAVERVVDSVSIAPSGTLVVPTPWAPVGRVDLLRSEQSLDVIFASDGVVQPRQILHRGLRSWGVAKYEPRNGPWIGGPNRISMTPAATTGNTTLTASEPYFRSGHVGSLIGTTHIGRTITGTLTAADQSTDYVSVVGVGTSRYFYISATFDGSWAGTLYLERSLEPDDPSVWTRHQSWTSGSFAGVLINDALSNITAHYRFRVQSHTGGTVAVQIDYDADVQESISRITAVNSTTEAEIEVLEPFGRTTTTRTWRIGVWSDVYGWPRNVLLHDGALSWFQADQHTKSVADDYDNFDTLDGLPSGSFQRSVGQGGESEVLWAASADRLLVGTARSECVIQPNEFDGALTSIEYTVRRPSRRGSANIRVLQHDDGLFFCQRSRRRVYELSMVQRGNRFESTEITRLNPAALNAKVKRWAIQQQPDTRLWLVLDDGSLVVITYDRRDEVIAITTVEIQNATIEDVETLPGDEQDDVYIITNRLGTRYVERFAPESLQSDPDTCALLDGHNVLEGTITNIGGATWFANTTVAVWADGKRRADVTLNSNGSASLGATYSRVVFGLPYTGTFKSVKLAYGGQLGASIGQDKIVKGVGLILANSCLDGIRIGSDAAHLDPLPDIVDGANRTASQFFAHYDQDITPINSTWDQDARFMFTIDSAEGPATVQGVALDIETRDGA